jgi:hypothetical protein
LAAADGDIPARITPAARAASSSTRVPSTFVAREFRLGERPFHVRLGGEVADRQSSVSVLGAWSSR